MLSKETRAALQKMIKELRVGLVPSSVYAELLLASAIIELDDAQRERSGEKSPETKG